jgi:hypothetical protein
MLQIYWRVSKVSDVLIGQKPGWKPTAGVIKLVWKPISKTWKGFGKPLINNF